MTDPQWLLLSPSLLLFLLLIYISKVKQRQASLLSRVQGQLDMYVQQYKQLTHEHKDSTDQIMQLRTELQSLKTQHEIKTQFWQQQSHMQKSQFEHMAKEILQQQQAQFQQSSTQHIHGAMTPLKEQIEQFKQHIQQQHTEDTKQRSLLQHELNSLKYLNKQISQEAINLTQALKGQNKTQGDWGEFILEKVLENSGLKLGREYHTQQELKNEEGGKLKPDVIVHLPTNRDVVIDAKMSLNAYEKYYNSENNEEKQEALKNHINSIQNHIKSLAKKDYHLLHGIKTLDYILMFIPIEPAFSLAIEKCPQIIKMAQQHHVMLVSPTNLILALRTIDNLWQNERQHKNAVEIAHAAGKMYDKLVSYTEDLDKLGRAIESAQESYKKASKKLSSGRHNLIRQAENMKNLGCTSNKVFARHYLDTSLVEQTEEK
tara:strand:- start:593 stop:1882 length:1290 start_codon:yes stop_codon:yes gene_type:complete